MQLKSLTVLVLALALSAVAHAQEAEGPKGISGRLEAAQSTDVKAEMQAYGGELKLAWVAAPGTQVEEGAKVAELEAPELQDAIAKSRLSVEAATNGLQSAQDALKHFEASFPEQLKAAQRRHDRAVEEHKHWQEVGRDRAIRNRELGLQMQKDRIEDQEEELRQLEALYKGNDLAKESQDIVLNRSKRRLAQDQERYENSLEDHKRYLEVDLPRTDEDREAGVLNTKLELDRLTAQEATTRADLTNKLSRAEWALKDAQEQLGKLEKDAASLEVKAPHAGIVAAGSDGVSPPLKVGDKLGKGAALLTVVDASVLHLTVALPLADRATYKSGTGVTVTCTDLSATASGTVQLVGMLVKDGKVSAKIQVDNAGAGLLPGARAEIKLAE